MSRGRDPGDDERFSAEATRRLREAAGDLAWMLGRAYPSGGAIALVGDRYELDSRARLALQRGVSSNSTSLARAGKRVEVGEALEVDALNLIVTLEVALCGGPVFLGTDGAMRDLAGLRGSYRLLAETDGALTLLADLFRTRGVRSCRWWVDAPVSNSGALAARLRAFNDALGLAGEVSLVRDADPELAGRSGVVSSDARVIDDACSWVALAEEALAPLLPPPWIVSLQRVNESARSAGCV